MFQAPFRLLDCFFIVTAVPFLRNAAICPIQRVDRSGYFGERHFCDIARRIPKGVQRVRGVEVHHIRKIFP
jgi:hypothetical protein